MKSPKLVVVVGETASGKSSIGMEIARKYNGEIIAADSRTVYKQFDIGTAKPSADDQNEIPHHLLDVVEPDQPFNASDFKKLANKAIEDISSRGKLPIMVGGTGLYIDGVIFDFDFAKAADPGLRKKLNKMSDEQLVTLVEETGATDISLKNRRHMTRFLESGGSPKQELVLRENTLVIGITRPKAELRQRIEQRVEQMFRAGLRKEIEDLVEKYGWDNKAMSGIIYHLFKDYEQGKISMMEVKRQFVQKDLLYAKRQRTWFKRNIHIQWYNNEETLLLEVEGWLEATIL